MNRTRNYTDADRLYAMARQEVLPTRVHITREPWDFANMGGDLYFLAGHSIVFILLLFIVESGTFAWFVKDMQLKKTVGQLNPDVEQAVSVFDEDVEKEA